MVNGQGLLPHPFLPLVRCGYYPSVRVLHTRFPAVHRMDYRLCALVVAFSKIQILLVLLLSDKMRFFLLLNYYY